MHVGLRKRDVGEHVPKGEAGRHLGDDVIGVLVARAVGEEIVIGRRKVLVAGVRARKSAHGGDDATLDLEAHRREIRHGAALAVSGNEEIAAGTGCGELSLRLGEHGLPE